MLCYFYSKWPFLQCSLIFAPLILNTDICNNWICIHWCIEVPLDCAKDWKWLWSDADHLIDDWSIGRRSSKYKNINFINKLHLFCTHFYVCIFKNVNMLSNISWQSVFETTESGISNVWLVTFVFDDASLVGFFTCLQFSSRGMHTVPHQQIWSTGEPLLVYIGLHKSLTSTTSKTHKNYVNVNWTDFLIPDYTKVFHRHTVKCSEMSLHKCKGCEFLIKAYKVLEWDVHQTYSQIMTYIKIDQYLMFKVSCLRFHVSCSRFHVCTPQWDQIVRPEHNREKKGVCIDWVTLKSIYMYHVQ